MSTPGNRDDGRLRRSSEQSRRSRGSNESHACDNHVSRDTHESRDTQEIDAPATAPLTISATRPPPFADKRDASPYYPEVELGASETPQCSAIPPEIEEGNVEHKLKLMAPSSERFQQLVTQLKWRLGEGEGEAVYELGVSDSGLLVGLTDAEMEQSLATLARMVRAVGAEIGELRERRVGPMARHVLTTTQRLRESPVVATGDSHDSVTQRLCESPAVATGDSVTQRPRESLVTADTIFRSTIDGLLREQQHSTPGRRSSTATSPSPASANSVAMSPRIAEGVLDSLQYASYKVATVVIRAAYVRGVRSCAEESTLLGYLSYDELDNGRGKSRLHLLVHRHEIETGCSSSITQTAIGFDAHGALLNHRSPGTRRPSFEMPTTVCTQQQIVEQSSKVVHLIDTGGHSRYVDATIDGLRAYMPDYACLVVDGNVGCVDAAARRLFACAQRLCLPVMVVLTKIDLNHPDADLGQSKLKDTLQELLAVLSDVPCAAVSDVPPITRLSRLPLPSATPMVIETDADVDHAAVEFQAGRATPIFLVSCVSGENLALLVRFLSRLSARDRSSAASSDGRMTGDGMSNSSDSSDCDTGNGRERRRTSGTPPVMLLTGD